MKKYIRIMTILACCFIFAGCSQQDQEKSKGILPTRIEQIDQGGVIPEGHEAKVESESEYSLDMLWGTWVLKGSRNEEVHVTDKTIDIGSVETDAAVEVECFPSSMSFNPAWAGNSLTKGRRLAESNLKATEDNMRLVFGHRFRDSEIVIEEEPLGNVLEKNGYGFGCIEFQATENGDASDKLSAISYGDRKIAYSICDDTLAIGVTDAGVFDDLTETDILEIDYIMNLKGCELELSYQGETAVYVPEQLESEYCKGINMRNAGVTDNYIEIDHIKGITILPEEDILYDFHGGNSLMFDTHEGFVEASYDFGEDGILTINSSKGDVYEYEYIYSGDALTLIADEQTAVYSLYNYVLEAQNETPTHTFYANGNEIRLGGDESVSDLLEKGFHTSVAMNQPIASCQVTDEIKLTYQGAELSIKAVNPYEQTAALGDCTVCYYCLNDKSGVLTKGDGSEVGVTTYDEIDFMYAPYEKEEAMLRYKGTTSGIIVPNYSDHDFGLFFAAKALQSSGLEVIYKFENGVLSQITIEDPALLYNGLQDNVDHSLLAQMEPTQFTGIIEIRNTILDRLKAAFAEAGIEANVNELTGEILMDNDILFGVDQYLLSSDGRQYIDSFMGVYASVITAEEFSDYISQVLFEGHTDSSGSYGYNLTLSQKRAEEVLNYCISSNYNGLNEIQKSTLQGLSTAIGYSSSDPILTETGREDMDASRRVSIKFYIKVNTEDDKNS